MTIRSMMLTARLVVAIGRAICLVISGVHFLAVDTMIHPCIFFIWIMRLMVFLVLLFFFSSRRRHTRYWRDWSSDVCSSDLERLPACRSTSRRSLAWSTASRCACRARRRPFQLPCPTQPVPTRGWAYERVSRVGVGRVHGSRRSLASARPVRVLTRGAGDLLPAGDDLERLLDRGRPPFRGGGVDGGRAAAGRRVLRRLHHREEPLGGQRVRLRPDLLVLRGARALPVQGAVLGRGGCARAARGLRARGGGAARALRLDDLRLRDRKSGVSGKSVDLGGRRIIKKKIVS